LAPPERAAILARASLVRRISSDFKFSLLSVKQLWNEQGIDARFCDINALVLPNQSGLIPYDPARPLSTVNAVPCANVAATAFNEFRSVVVE
jgi:hypothetical protein